MSDTRRVILAPEALSDLEGIADYIRQDSPQNAAAVAERILKAIDSLAMMANRGRQVGRSRRRGSPIRAMIVRPFIVYYRIDEEPAAVYVLNRRHGSRCPPRRFE